MAAVVGCRRQEQKIARMGELAHSMFPGIDSLAFKGAFRLGVREALRNQKMGDWATLCDAPPRLRRRFFRVLLTEALPHLRGIGLNETQIKALSNKLLRENERFLEN